MNGEEAFRAMRKIRDDVPVILSSGFNQQEAIQEFVGRGLAGFLQKPFSLESLREKLRQALS